MKDVHEKSDRFGVRAESAISSYMRELFKQSGALRKTTHVRVVPCDAILMRVDNRSRNFRNRWYSTPRHI